MIRRFLFCLFLSFVIFHLSSKSVLAGSPGLNLINQPGSGNSASQSVRDWELIIPEDPARLPGIAAQVSATNLVIRLHASWTGTGQQMLGSDAQQQQIADAWNNAISQISGKTIYIEPFNELERDDERRSPDGILSVDQAVARAKNFINKLQGRIISPGFDPLNPNHPAVIAAFGSYLDQFDIISYHPYSTDHYNNDEFPGKSYIFTEFGILENGTSGKPLYSTCAFVKLLCTDKMADTWKNRGNVLAYLLFTFAPGDAGSGWSINDDPEMLSDAMQGRCDNIDVKSIDDCDLNSKCRVSVLTKVNYQPTANDPLCRDNPHPAYARKPQPDAPNCSFSLTISENVGAMETLPDGSYPTSTQEKQGIKQDQTLDGPQPDDLRDISYNAGHTTQAILSTNPDIAMKKFKKAVNSYSTGYFFRITPKADLDAARRDLVLESVMSLAKNPTTIITDNIIAWLCDNGGQAVCKSQESDPSGACRPIFTSELALNSKYVTPNGQVGEIIDEQYQPSGHQICPSGQCLYANRHPKATANQLWIPDDCQKQIFDHLSPIPHGSVATKVTGYGTNEKGILEPTSAPIAIQHLQSLAGSTNNLAKVGISYRQTVSPPGNYCDTATDGKRYSGDTVYSGNIFTYILNQIFHVGPRGGDITASEPADTYYANASTLDTFKSAITTLISSKDQKKLQLNKIPKASYVQKDGSKLPIPGNDTSQTFESWAQINSFSTHF